MSPRSLLVLAPLFFALSACQQAAWKAGASADDLKRDDQACRAQTPDDDAAIKQCLRGKGWTVAEFSSPAEDDPATLTTSAVTANAAPATPQPVGPPLHPAVRSPTTAMSTATTKSTPSTESNVETAASSATTTVAAATKRVPDPLQRQSVQTWWKAGAQAADFNADANICLDQLGTEHTPDYAHHLYTRAMMNCLRARGWFAGRDPVYTPLR